MTERILRQVAPEKCDSAEERAAKLAERDVRARSRRKLWFGPESDGSVEFGGSLPVVAGRRLQSMVQAVSDRRYRSAKDMRDRLVLQETPQQRAADALVEILGAAEAAERGEARTPSIPAGAAQLQVLIPYQDLLDRAAASGLLADGTSLSAGELRVLACSAELIPAVLGSDSQVLDMGLTVRLAPPSLRRAIGLRDGGCAFPGCTTPMRPLRPASRAAVARGRSYEPGQHRGPVPGASRAVRTPTANHRGRRATDDPRRVGRPDRQPRTPRVPPTRGDGPGPDTGPPHGTRGNAVRP